MENPKRKQVFVLFWNEESNKTFENGTTACMKKPRKCIQFSICLGGLFGCPKKL